MKNKIIILSVFIVILVLVFGGQVYGGVLGWSSGASWSCSRNGDSVSCTLTQTQKWGCNQGHDPDVNNYCTKTGLGDEMPIEAQSILGETGELTQQQKQEFFDNLVLSGECRLGYVEGVWDYSGGEWGDPGCYWTRFKVVGQSYSALPCSNKNLGTCRVDMVNDRCFSPPNPDFQTQPIQIFFGSFRKLPYDEVNDLGSCSFSTILAQTVSTGTINVNTNLASATFTITGPASYSGSGTSWSQADAPAGTYTITYSAVSGYNTPSSDTKTLVAGSSITFTSTYTIKDSDSDGIPNSSDLCSNTPSGEVVDSDGCSASQIDTDADRISNADDQCDNKPEDFDGYMDTDGCPDPDNDGDGILDVNDQCPTQPESFNNYQDTDGCPDVVPTTPPPTTTPPPIITPAPTTTPPSPTTAPPTQPPIESPDLTPPPIRGGTRPADSLFENTQPTSTPKDSDGDHIGDDIDSCPNTPAGEVVDSDGCSASQKESIAAKAVIGKAESAISQEKAKGFDVLEAKALLEASLRSYNTNDYENAKFRAEQARDLALDIDQDGVPNYRDFAPSIKNTHIYAGVFVFFVSLIPVSKGAKWYLERRKEEKERIEKKKAEIIDMIEEVVNEKRR